MENDKQEENKVVSKFAGKLLKKDDDNIGASSQKDDNLDENLTNNDAKDDNEVASKFAMKFLKKDVKKEEVAGNFETDDKELRIQKKYGQKWLKNRQNDDEFEKLGSVGDVVSKAMLTELKNHDRAVKFMVENIGFTSALAENVYQDMKKITRAYKIIDNSGSMNVCDGRYFEEKDDGGFRTKKCTRWKELRDSIAVQAEFAGKCRVFTNFKLLNAPKMKKRIRNYNICETIRESEIKHEIETLMEVLDTYPPRGKTPIAKRLKEVLHDIDKVEAKDKGTEKRFSIEITTDGLPTDGDGEEGEKANNDLLDLLNELSTYSVTFLIRIVTNERKVIDYYNELGYGYQNFDILDDYKDEYKEISRKNRWMNYSFPLHRCREMGYFNHVFNALDDQKLTMSEMVKYCELIFGEERMNKLPRPEEEWEGFAVGLKILNESEAKVWSIHHNRKEPWIHMNQLHEEYGIPQKRGGFGSRIRNSVMGHTPHFHRKSTESIDYESSDIV